MNWEFTHFFPNGCNSWVGLGTNQELHPTSSMCMARAQALESAFAACWMEGENLKARQCSYLLTYSPNSHKGWDWIRTKLRAGNQELIDLPLCGRDSTTLDITHCLPESTSAVCWSQDSNSSTLIQEWGIVTDTHLNCQVQVCSTSVSLRDIVMYSLSWESLEYQFWLQV